MMPREAVTEAEADLLQRIRDAGHQAIANVYASELRNNDGLFGHLGFIDQPTMAEFQSRYVKQGAVDYEKLMADVWGHLPTAVSWRAAYKAAGITAERYLGGMLETIEQLEEMSPAPPELEQFCRVYRFMAQNAAWRH